MPSSLEQIASVVANSTTTTATTTSATTGSDDSLKLALAIAIIRSKFFHKQSDAPPDSEALRWKQKAKQRKQEILRLREDLKEADDVSRWDLFPESAACRCYFFDNLGELISTPIEVDSVQRFSDVLHRRFLREVRFRERKRKSNSSYTWQILSDLQDQDELEQLRASVDFLVEMCSSSNHMKVANFTNWSHQAVDFILGSVKHLLSIGKNMELIEGIINSLIMRLVRSICPASYGDTCHIHMDNQFHIQHLIRKLGSEQYIGQRTILSLSQRIYVVTEKLLYLDPFDDAFPNMHACLFTMIQLIEFLLSDYLLIWSNDEAFDNALFGEWVASVSQARKGLELLENRNVLYVMYMDRVMGLLAKQVGQISSLQNPNRDILDKLFGSSEK